MTEKAMTAQQIEVLANELRVLIQKRTCCPQHAGDVLLQVMAGFFLDSASHDRHQAAAAVRRAAKAVAEDIAVGRYAVIRSAQ